MEVKAIYRGARISAFKVREVTREIQGLAASAALDLVAFSPKKAAAMIGKTLRSAIANAENNADLRVDRLIVKEATAGEGPSMKRFKSRARGSASTIVKRTSHIRIILSDDSEPTSRKSKTVDRVHKPRKGQKAAPMTQSATPLPARATTSAEATNELADGPK